MRPDRRRPLQAAILLCVEEHPDYKLSSVALWGQMAKFCGSCFKWSWRVEKCGRRCQCLGLVMLQPIRFYCCRIYRRLNSGLAR